MVRLHDKKDILMTKQAKVQLIRVGSLKRDTRASFVGTLAEGVIRYQQS